MEQKQRDREDVHDLQEACAVELIEWLTNMLRDHEGEPAEMLSCAAAAEEMVPKLQKQGLKEHADTLQDLAGKLKTVAEGGEVEMPRERVRDFVWDKMRQWWKWDA